MANSTDPDQLAFKPTDLDIHCLQNRVYPGSAGQGLTLMMLKGSWCTFKADNSVKIVLLSSERGSKRKTNGASSSLLE